MGDNQDELVLPDATRYRIKSHLQARSKEMERSSVGQSNVMEQALLLMKQLAEDYASTHGYTPENEKVFTSAVEEAMKCVSDTKAYAEALKGVADRPEQWSSVNLMNLNFSTLLNDQFKSIVESAQSQNNHKRKSAQAVLNVRRKMFHAENPNEVFPDDEDADVAVVGDASQLQTQCPILLMDLVEPMKNTACGHTYSKEGIMSLLKKRRSIPCPLPGCGSTVTRATLVLDTEVEMQLGRIKRVGASQMLTQHDVVDLDDDDDEEENEEDESE